MHIITDHSLGCLTTDTGVNDLTNSGIDQMIIMMTRLFGSNVKICGDFGWVVNLEGREENEQGNAYGELSSACQHLAEM